MAIIRPFKAFRPKKDLAEKIASRPYDVLNSSEARAEAKGNEYSFLRVNKPEIDLAEDVDVYSKEVYAKGAANLKSFITQNWLTQDEAPCYYIYAQKMGKHQQFGLVACSSIDDYFNNVIKKHEYTRPKKEKDRIDHMYALGAHIGPVFLTYRPVAVLDQIIEKWVNEHGPAYDFASEDGIQHTVWVIDNKTVNTDITKIFESKIPATYVADGHHRSAASAIVGQRMRDEKGSCTGEEDFNFFLSVLFPSNQLKIIDYNRLVKDLLHDITNEEFLTALLANFQLTPEKKLFYPKERGEFALYMDKQWYRLQADDSIITDEDPVEALDISIISNYVIDPLLGIEDQRTDDRIDFVGGIRGLEELERRVDSGEMKLAIAIPPVSIDQLLAVADSGTVMPPKTTWFEPKLRSGLLIHKFND